MTKLFKHYLFLLLALCTGVAQAQVTFSVAYKKVSATQIDIVFTGKADAGWHIYSTDIPDGGPTPASFGIDEAKGVKLAGKLKAGAGAKTMQDPIFEMPVTFFENTAVFTQRVELTQRIQTVEETRRRGCAEGDTCIGNFECITFCRQRGIGYEADIRRWRLRRALRDIQRNA